MICDFLYIHVDSSITLCHFHIFNIYVYNNISNVMHFHDCFYSLGLQWSMPYDMSGLPIVDHLSYYNIMMTLNRLDFCVVFRMHYMAPHEFAWSLVDNLKWVAEFNICCCNYVSHHFVRLKVIFLNIFLFIVHYKKLSRKKFYR